MAAKAGIKTRRSPKKRGYYAANYNRTARNKTRKLLRWSKRIVDPTPAHKADVDRSIRAITLKAASAPKRT